MSKYTTNEEESQCLPNRLGLTRPGEIAEAEFEGFLLAEIMLTETLTTATRFDCQYIRNIHKLALKELYTFAGRYRTVNMSKGGFLFPSALFIPQSMQFFEDEEQDWFAGRGRLLHIPGNDLEECPEIAVGSSTLS